LTHLTFQCLGIPVPTPNSCPICQVKLIIKHAMYDISKQFFSEYPAIGEALECHGAMLVY